MHVAVHGRQNDLALRVALGFLEEEFQMLHRFLHDFSGLKHEWKNELAGAELVADLFHCRQ